MNVYSWSCPAYWNPPADLRSSFWEPDSQYSSGLLKKPASDLTAKSVSQNKDSGTAFSKVCTISKFFHRSDLNINFCISQELRSQKMLKPAKSTNLIFQKLKCSPISGETVPLNRGIIFITFYTHAYWAALSWLRRLWTFPERKIMTVFADSEIHRLQFALLWYALRFMILNLGEWWFLMKYFNASLSIMQK